VPMRFRTRTISRSVAAPTSSTALAKHARAGPGRARGTLWWWHNRHFQTNGAPRGARWRLHAVVAHAAGTSRGGISTYRPAGPHPVSSDKSTVHHDPGDGAGAAVALVGRKHGGSSSLDADGIKRVSGRDRGKTARPRDQGVVGRVAMGDSTDEIMDMARQSARCRRTRVSTC